jgi:hypothetical protein
VPVEPSSLPANLAAAEQSQLLQTAAQLQGRAQDQAAAAQSQDQGKREAAEAVQETREAELGALPAGDRGSAPSPSPGDEGKKAPRRVPSDPAPEEDPPDPAGRGRKIDLRG